MERAGSNLRPFVNVKENENERVYCWIDFRGSCGRGSFDRDNLRDCGAGSSRVLYGYGMRGAGRQANRTVNGGRRKPPFFSSFLAFGIGIGKAFDLGLGFKVGLRIGMLFWETNNHTQYPFKATSRLMFSNFSIFPISLVYR